jgi:uncharacterized membrane protein YkvA (DUF1232 family)
MLPLLIAVAVAGPVTEAQRIGSWHVGSWWWDLLLGIAAGLLLAWVALIVALVIARPRGGLLREALRLLPDVLRLLPRLAADRSLPRGVRVRLALLLAYLAFPIDLVPDFIPVVGYADDAIIVAAALRSVVRRAGIRAVERHWPGTHDGFAALCRLTGLTPREALRPAGQPPAQQD